MTRCSVFRSEKKNEAYLYLDTATPFEDLPAELQTMFGEPVLVMALDLSSTRKLARVDIKRVIKALQQQGFYLQLPPKIPTEEEISRRFS